MKLNVLVTERHCREGRRCSSIRCPIALACADAMEGRWSVGNVTGGIRFSTLDGVRLECDTPEWLASIIDAYDQGADISPMEFELDLMEC